MPRLLRHAPSPTLVIALVALAVSATGTAIATSRLAPGDHLVKKHSLSGNRLRDHTISQRQVKLSKLGVVPRARLAGSATALGGIRSQAFAPVLYARVSAAGVVDPKQSKGIRQSNITRGEGGSYCFHGLPFKPRGGSAVVDFGSGLSGAGAGAQLAIAATGHTIDCQGAENVEVATSSDSDAGPATFAPEPFYVVLYG